jgi:hypothetical protein
MDKPYSIIYKFIEDSVMIDLADLCCPETKLRKHLTNMIEQLEASYRKDVVLEIDEQYLEFKDYFKSHNITLRQSRKKINKYMNTIPISINKSNTQVINPEFIAYCENGVKFVLLSLRANRDNVCKLITKHWKSIRKNSYFTFEKNKRTKLKFPIDNATSKLYDSFLKNIDNKCTPVKYCDAMFELLSNPRSITMSIIEINSLIQNKELCLTIFKI